jgi:F-type H+-transporting ATPase subunit epsilon
MLLEIITPDNMLYQGEVKEVILPGLDGSLGILDNHAPLVSALNVGKCKVVQSSLDNEVNGTFSEELAKELSFEFDIKGGVVEVKTNKVIVLAE